MALNISLLYHDSSIQIDMNRAVHIMSVIMLRRSDKSKDRVEISPEQLSMAASEAEISFDNSVTESV